MDDYYVNLHVHDYHHTPKKELLQFHNYWHQYITGAYTDALHDASKESWDCPIYTFE